MNLNYLTIHKDGSLINSESKTMHLGIDRFIKEICEGSNCFLCGSSPDDKIFNNEHIIPNWILKKTNMHNSFITLPNKEKKRYSQYTIRCCKECNSFLGTTFEEEIGKVVDEGLESINQYIETRNGQLKIFLWLSLIFLKTHLKDNSIRLHLDARKGEDTIGESLYDWETLHHIHCMVSTIKTGVAIDSKCIGSMMVLPVHNVGDTVTFDYADMHLPHTIMLRIGEVAFLAVLDDSCACLPFLDDHTQKITAPLSPLQLIEMHSHLSYLNMNLKERPTYLTKYDYHTAEFIIDAELPDRWLLEKYSPEEFGHILYFNTAQKINNMADPKIKSKENIEAIKRGEISFLFDANGKQCTGHLDK